MTPNSGLIFIIFVYMKLLFAILFPCFLYCQNVDKHVNELCSLLPVFAASKMDSLDFYSYQLDVSLKILEKNYTESSKNVDISKEDVLNFTNVYNYKLQRELRKKCPEKIIETNLSLLPSSNVVDFEKVFSLDQYKSLKDQILEIRKDKGLAILIVEIDELFPFATIDESASYFLKNDIPYFDLEKGKMVIVFSKNLREIQINTNDQAQQYLSDEYLQELIKQFIFPKFRNGNYFEGISLMLQEINTKL